MAPDESFEKQKILLMFMASFQVFSAMTVLIVPFYNHVLASDVVEKLTPEIKFKLYFQSMILFLSSTIYLLPFGLDLTEYDIYSYRRIWTWYYIQTVLLISTIVVLILACIDGQSNSMIVALSISIPLQAIFLCVINSFLKKLGRVVIESECEPEPSPVSSLELESAEATSSIVTESDEEEGCWQEFLSNPCLCFSNVEVGAYVVGWIQFTVFWLKCWVIIIKILNNRHNNKGRDPKEIPEDFYSEHHGDLVFYAGVNILSGIIGGVLVFSVPFKSIYGCTFWIWCHYIVVTLMFLAWLVATWIGDILIVVILPIIIVGDAYCIFVVYVYRGYLINPESGNINFEL